MLNFLILARIRKKYPCLSSDNITCKKCIKCEDSQIREKIGNKPSLCLPDVCAYYRYCSKKENSTKRNVVACNNFILKDN